MPGQADEVDKQCAKCPGDASKPCRQPASAQASNKVLSEYTATYVKMPYAPRMKPTPPGTVKIVPNSQIRTKFATTSTYATDYVKNNNSLNPNAKPAQQHGPAAQTEDTQLSGEKSACPVYDLSTLQASIPAMKKGKSDGDDFKPLAGNFPPLHHPVHGTGAEKPHASSPPTKFILKPPAKIPPGGGKHQGLKLGSNDQSTLISTAKADYTKPENPERPRPCIPVCATKMYTDKFQDSTTFADSFYEKPVHRRVVPSWAIRKPYKRPEKGGMLENSCYKHDYRNPEMILPPSAIRPDNSNKYMLSNKSGDDHKLEKDTTYTVDFQYADGSKPRQSFKINRTFDPPTEKMAGVTNMKDSFKGAYQEKLKPCRHPSNHRDLRVEMPMASGTTYAESFQNPIVHVHHAFEEKLIDVSNNNSDLKPPTPLVRSTHHVRSTPCDISGAQDNEVLHRKCCCCYSTSPQTPSPEVITYNRPPSSVPSESGIHKALLTPDLQRAPSTAGSSRVSSVAGSNRAPSSVPSVSGIHLALDTPEPQRAPSTAGSSRVSSVAGSSRVSSVAGSYRAPSVAGSGRVSSVAGTCRHCGSNRAPSVAGSQCDRLIVNPSRACSPNSRASNRIPTPRITTRPSTLLQS